jgi:hypothetical protein
MKNFFRKWLAFFRPVDGWKRRLLQFKSGNTAWEVPGKPDAPKVVPFPVQWIPWRALTSDEELLALELKVEIEALEKDEDATTEALEALKQKSEAASALTARFLDCTCIDSGKLAPVGVGVLCCRCGVPLHPEYANMMGGFDPPYCNRCRWPLLLLGR